jgi:hypothetical protein
MHTRLLIQAAFILASLPLAACSGDDDTNGDNTGGTGGGTQASPWAGHTYTLTTTKFDWTVPKGLGKDIENVMPVFMFQMTTTSGKDMTAKIASAPKLVDEMGNPVAGTLTQDPCTPTIELPVSGAAYPNSVIGPTTMDLHLVSKAGDPGPAGDVQVTARVVDLKFTNILPTGSEPTETNALDATMDIKDIAPLFTALGSPPTTEAVCGELAKQNSPCQACPGTGTMTCLSAKAQLITSVDAPGMTVATIDPNSRPATCANTY